MRHFLQALFQTSRETRSGINGLLGIRVIPSHPVCRGFMLEKRAPDGSRSESNVVYARSGPSAFLPFRMRRRRPACCIRRAAPLQFLGTKTPCRTITLNKSLPPIAIRRGSSTRLFMSALLSKQDQNDRRHRLVPAIVRNSSLGATPSPIIENFKGDPIVSRPNNTTPQLLTVGRDPTPNCTGREGNNFPWFSAEMIYVIRAESKKIYIIFCCT